MITNRLLVFLLLISTLSVSSQTVVDEPFNCFTLVAGKGATTDGSVMLAHNEDDYGQQIVNWLVVPRQEHPEGSVVKTQWGGQIKQVSGTSKYLWFEMPGMSFSDSYLNEHGVVVVSNACHSREDSADLTQGGIGWELRQVMAQRATTAREAVVIAAQLIEQFGYASSGRTYTVADPNEAWMLSVVKGKHYLAHRIPDGAVAILPNYYTLGNVNLSDTLNCIASPDLVSYAVKRGWYKPETGKSFNFREVYGSESSLTHPVNIKRMWGAINLISSRYFEMDETFPWIVAPQRKVTVEWFANILGSHYEGTPLDLTDGYTKGHPHADSADAICAAHNQYGFVAQLRNWMPAETGALLWMMPRRPCVQAMIPIYCGVDSLPSNYTFRNFRDAIDHHFDKPEDLLSATPDHIYWKFSRVADSADSNYLRRARQIGPAALKFNRNLLLNQEQFELDVLKLGQTNKKAATRALNLMVINKTDEWLQTIRKILETQPAQW